MNRKESVQELLRQLEFLEPRQQEAIFWIIDHIDWVWEACRNCSFSEDRLNWECALSSGTDDVLWQALVQMTRILREERSQPCNSAPNVVQ